MRFDRKTMNFETHFWNRIEVGLWNECWLWKAGTNRQNGRVLVNDTRRDSPTYRKQLLAHRVAYELTFGPLKHNGLHECDTPLCCNPWHIEDGTQAKNMRDMHERGRRKPNKHKGI